MLPRAVTRVGLLATFDSPICNFQRWLPNILQITETSCLVVCLCKESTCVEICLLLLEYWSQNLYFLPQNLLLFLGTFTLGVFSLVVLEEELYKSVNALQLNTVQ